MTKKFICTVCGYVHEGNEAPEKCPQCHVPASKFKELNEEEAIQFVTEHVIGVAKGCDEEMIADLNAHFIGECTEVGMYLAMSRQADREGYPEVAEAFKRYAWEEAEHAAKFAELLGDVVWDTKTNLEKRMTLITNDCWKLITEEITAIYPNLQTYIYNLSPDFSEQEWKYCCFYMYGFDTNAEAKLLNININSVKTKHMRLRQKLNIKLPPKSTLYDYLIENME